MTCDQCDMAETGREPDCEMCGASRPTPDEAEGRATGSGPTIDDLYVRVSLDEPSQFVGVHPVRWHDHPEPTAAFVELDRWTELGALVHAAPELLAACEGILRAFETGDFKRTRPRQAETDPYHPALVDLRAAIAKARGEER